MNTTYIFSMRDGMSNTVWSGANLYSSALALIQSLATGGYLGGPGIYFVASPSNLAANTVAVRVLPGPDRRCEYADDFNTLGETASVATSAPNATRWPPK